MGDTAAVKVTDWPRTDGFMDEVKMTLVGADTVVKDQTGEDVAPAALVAIALQ